MKGNILVALLALCYASSVQTRSKKLARLQGDPLSTTRCDLMCSDVKKEGRSQCRSECRTKQQKPGTCPVSDNPKWAAACVEACNSDAQCDGTQRCCHHGCGSACSEPVDLSNTPGLPALPVVEEVKEKRRSVVVRWSNGVGDVARAVPGKVLYLLQEQHHLGPKYEEARLGGWSLVVRTNKTKVALRDLLKAGRWYRFRVAAVSAAGTRGFSLPGPPFTPRKGPRAPPSPKRLKVRPVRAKNGTITVRLEWKEPRSDLPVMRYKVFWSRRVRGINGELDSVLVNHQTVPKDQTSLEISDLLPNSMYFLQVQTISQFGLGKLRSEKAAVFYNTTSASDQSPAESVTRASHQKTESKTTETDQGSDKITGLKLHKIIWNFNKLRAKLSWDPLRTIDRRTRRYFVEWKPLKCANPHNKTSLSAVTQKTTFEIYELDYHCTYKVNVNLARKSNKPNSEITVSVPDCKYFQRRMNGTVLDCN